jgi:quinol monooxygenase YgiN
MLLRAPTFGTIPANTKRVVFAVLKLFIAPSHRADVLEMLRSMQGRIELCYGYLGTWLHEGDLPSYHILYAEQWDSEEALQQHIRSPIYRRVLAAIDLSIKPPEVSFHFVSHSKGLELIQTLRTSPTAHNL